MADERPKPKYGELAPEGWVWNPPAPPAGSDVPVPASEQGAPPAPQYGQAGQGGPWAPPQQQPHNNAAPPSLTPPAPYRAGGPAPVRTGDIAATVLLLFAGLLFSVSMIPALFDFNTVLRQAAAMQGYGTFEPTSAANTAGIVAGVATIILQLGSIALSVRRIARRRLAFPVPLIFGVITFLAWVVAITFAFFNDPSFVQQLQNSGAPTP